MAGLRSLIQGPLRRNFVPDQQSLALSRVTLWQDRIRHRGKLDSDEIAQSLFLFFARLLIGRRAVLRVADCRFIVSCFQHVGVIDHVVGDNHASIAHLFDLIPVHVVA